MTKRTVTDKQLDYIRSLAHQHRVSEEALLEIRGLEAERIEALDIDAASGLIDWLINTPAGEIGRLAAKARGQLELA